MSNNLQLFLQTSLLKTIKSTHIIKHNINNTNIIQYKINVIYLPHRTINVKQHDARTLPKETNRTTLLESQLTVLRMQMR